MSRKLALVAGVFFAAVSAGSVTAQTTATPKPTSSSSTMQHAPAALPKAGGQDSATVHASAAATVHHAAWTKDQIKEAQQGLLKAGYYKGTPTGIFNRSTRKAIRSYQKANKLPVTGRLNEDLLKRLHSS
jgi:peptidoglycan hydrolase-like protein with peptidoglycan-binding domain